MTESVYLDYNATTPVDPAVLNAMLPYLQGKYGNPSSAHAIGGEASEAVAAARGQVALLLGADPGEIVFASSATEANNLAIHGVTSALQARGRHLITTAIEHPSVLQPMIRLRDQGWDVTIIPVDANGCVMPGRVAEAVRPDTVLISVMHANNETGSIQPVADIASIARAHGIVVHTDAAQSVGKIAVDVNALGVDLLTVAGHKYYAPKGTGALYIRAGTPIFPCLAGAGQERGLRPGTENVAGIVALGKASELAYTHLPTAEARLIGLRELLHQSLNKKVPGLMLNGHPAARLPNTLNVSFPGVEGKELLYSVKGQIFASIGSACHSKDPDHGGVLHAMNLDDARVAGAVRLSVGLPTGNLDVLFAATALAAAWRKITGRGSLRIIEKR